MRQASRTAMSRYNDTERQAAFAEGYVHGAFNIDIDLMTIKDINEQQPQQSERVLAVMIDYRTDDDFDCELKMLRYDAELFTKLGVKYWLPFTLNIKQHG